MIRRLFLCDLQSQNIIGDKDWENFSSVELEKEMYSYYITIIKSSCLLHTI